MNTILSFICGYFAGTIVLGIFLFLSLDKYYVGDLREDRSIPEEPYYFMEIGAGRFDRLKRNRFALLKIVRENYRKDS